MLLPPSGQVLWLPWLHRVAGILKQPARWSGPPRSLACWLEFSLLWGQRAGCGSVPSSRCWGGPGEGVPAFLALFIPAPPPSP